MTVELDHFIVSARNPVAAARLLGEILGVPWAEKGMGPFSPVYINAGLTLDFIESQGDLQVEHFCFRVSEKEFDLIIDRIIAFGIPYRSDVRGPMDSRINSDYGGRIIYWNEPEGHQWEMLTVSYARAERVAGVFP